MDALRSVPEPILIVFILFIVLPYLFKVCGLIDDVIKGKKWP